MLFQTVFLLPIVGYMIKFEHFQFEVAEINVTLSTSWWTIWKILSSMANTLQI